MSCLRSEVREDKGKTSAFGTFKAAVKGSSHRRRS